MLLLMTGSIFIGLGGEKGIRSPFSLKVLNNEYFWVTMIDHVGNTKRVPSNKQVIYSVRTCG